MRTLLPIVARLGVLLALLAPASALEPLARADESTGVDGRDDASQQDPQKVSVDIHDARLIDVVVRFSQVTGENFVLMEKDLAEKRITVYAPTPVTIAEARDLLITVLTLSGLEVEDEGAYYAITRAD